MDIETAASTSTVDGGATTSVRSVALSSAERSSAASDDCGCGDSRGGGVVAHPAAHKASASVQSGASFITTSRALRRDLEIDRQRLGVGSVAEVDGLLALLHDAVAVLKGYCNSERLGLGESFCRYFPRHVLLHLFRLQQGIERRSVLLRLLWRRLRRFLSKRLQLRHDVDR